MSISTSLWFSIIIGHFLPDRKMRQATDFEIPGNHSYLPLDFNRVSSLRPTYRHPFGRPFTYSLFSRSSFQAWDCHGPGTRCCGPRGGTVVRMEQKTRSKFLPWPGYNLGPWHLAATEVATGLPRTPPFSRLLRHAGGYSRTILTPNLHGFMNNRSLYRP